MRMYKTSKLAGVAIAAIAMATAAPAFAADQGTDAGTSIENIASVSYEVAGVGQTPVTDNDIFVVDRKIVFTLEETGNVTTNVTLNQADAATAFTLTNNTNAPLDFAFTLTQIGTGAAVTHGGTDAFNILTPKIYHDVDGSGTLTAGDVEITTHFDELAEGTSVSIIVVGNIPTTGANGSKAGVQLEAIAYLGGGTGTQGALVTHTTTADVAGTVDNVIATANQKTVGPNIVASSIDQDDYTIAAPTITVEKTSRIVSDPINGTSNPKRIPGAVVEYCILVRNAGGAAATNVAVSDTVPLALTATAGTSRTGDTCVWADETAGGTITTNKPSSADSVAASFASVPANNGTTDGIATLIFRTTID